MKRDFGYYFVLCLFFIVIACLFLSIILTVIGLINAGEENTEHERKCELFCRSQNMIFVDADVYSKPFNCECVDYENNVKKFQLGISVK